MTLVATQKDWYKWDSASKMFIAEESGAAVSPEDMMKMVNADRAAGYRPSLEDIGYIAKQINKSRGLPPLKGESSRQTAMGESRRYEELLRTGIDTPLHPTMAKVTDAKLWIEYSEARRFGKAPAFLAKHGAAIEAAHEAKATARKEAAREAVETRAKEKARQAEEKARQARGASIAELKSELFERYGSFDNATQVNERPPAPEGSIRLWSGNITSSPVPVPEGAHFLSCTLSIDATKDGVLDYNGRLEYRDAERKTKGDRFHAVRRIADIDALMTLQDDIERVQAFQAPSAAPTREHPALAMKRAMDEANNAPSPTLSR